jgi:aminopeptidase N
VTCKDWSHLWLNEGFATFMEASFKEHTEGRQAYMDALKTDAFTYFSAEAYGRRHPLVHKHYKVGSELFDATTYQKGAFVIHMLRQTVGDENFWKAVNVYLNEYKFKPAETADLQRIFERVSGQDLKWFFDQWVYKAGFPALKVSYLYDKKLRRLKLNINQTHTFDAMTPAVFRLSADVQIITSKGVRNEKIEINKRTQIFTFKLDEAPSQVWVDRNFNLLRLLDFPQAQEQMKKAA